MLRLSDSRSFSPTFAALGLLLGPLLFLLGTLPAPALPRIGRGTRPGSAARFREDGSFAQRSFP